MDKQFILTIAIPTYNRSPYLDESLRRISNQLEGLLDKVELIVSDNCSNDNTPEIVGAHIAGGLNITYVRNAKNIGMDGNFVQCFKMAKAKYVWVLGDDDYLLPNSIKSILQILEGGDYGLIHLKVNSSETLQYVIYNDYRSMYSEISYWITFISSNIVRTDYVASVNFEQYIGSYFTLIPLYLKAMVSHPQNIMVYQKVFEGGAAYETAGGYNFFEVFIKNYLNIIHEFVSSKHISMWRYEYEKYNLFRFYIFRMIKEIFLYRKDNHNYKTKGAYRIIFSKYWYEPYLYLGYVYYLLIKTKHLFRPNKK